MAKILLFTGKGGVGKTVISAATALQAGEMGYRTVVMSTDPAHSLGDSLDQRLGPEPEKIATNLWAQESDVLYNIEKYWGTVRRWLAAVFSWRGVNEMEAMEVAILPGMDELASLIWVYEHYQSGDYDVIVVDCAPTGESLRFLTVPEIGEWWVDKLLAMVYRVPSVLRALSPLSDMPIPEDKVIEDFGALFRQLEKIHSLLTDADLSRIRLIVNPEKIVIRETQRSYAHFNLHGYPVDAVICNKFIPEEANGVYWKEWKSTQARYIELINECFSPLPVLMVPMLKHEVVGIEALREMAGYLYPGKDPTERLFEGKAITVEPNLLTLKLPFAEKGDISLLKTGDELIVRIGGQKRNILLPQALSDKEPDGATLEEGLLKIRFKEE